MAISVSDIRTGMRHKYIRTYFRCVFFLFPLISRIDAESVLFYLFNLRNLCDL